MTDTSLDDLTPRPASRHTAERNSAAVIDFDDETDWAAARRGLVAQHPTGRIELDGRAVWDTANHDFLRGDAVADAPATCHPGLWRQGRLNAVHGLFEVGDGVWQARGYDLSNITFIAGDSGWLIIDPLTAAETARACLELADEHLGARPVTAVIYTHSHVDHFGGMLGVTTRDAVERGDVRVIAPEGFMHEVVGENLLAGPIMLRRSLYQFGPLLPPGPTGQVDAGLGKTVPLGRSDLVAPTETISETGTELTIDGVRVVFQSTPNAEAPAEMNFFFPDHGLLCMAENCTHTMHNLYPIRGALARDSLAWSKYIHEALRLWGDHAETSFASHHWPRFGNDDVRAFLALQRDVYRWIHDQTLRLANHGHTPTEIADELGSLPSCFSHQSHVQGYYGTLSHNARSVYNRYLGWYDGNPANLDPIPNVPRSTKYVELMGGADAVLAAARSALDAGEERWALELTNHVVFADPTNRAARLLGAEASEQLGYQSESSTWRNAYLMGAFELRHGSLQLGRAGPPAMAAGMSGEQLVDVMGVRLDPTRLPDDRRSLAIAFEITDLGETHVLTVENDAVHHDPAASGVASDVTVRGERGAIVGVVAAPEQLEAAEVDGRLTVVSGDRSALLALLGALDGFDGMNLIEP
ncbi:MAG: alkyl sulfatase dimerization domain-containing protein [Actinomycetota bacterium]